MIGTRRAAHTRLADRPDVLEAVGSIFDNDPDRIRALARQLQPREPTIESTARGVSMGDTIPDGTKLLIRLSEQEPAAGEVVAFLLQKRVVVHRVVHVGRNAARRHLLTRGDAEGLPDPPVECRHVLGPVVAIERKGVWCSVPGPAVRPGTERALASVALAATRSAMIFSPRFANALLRGVQRTRRLYVRVRW